MWRKIFEPQYRLWQWAFCLATSLYVFLFLMICEPFKSIEIPYTWASRTDFIEHSVIDFVGLTLGCALSLIFLPKFFPKYFSAENLSLGRLCFLILLLTLSVVTGNFFSNHIYFHTELSLSWFLIFLFKVTIPILIFPVLPFFYIFINIFNYYTQTKKGIEEPAITNNFSFDAANYQLEEVSQNEKIVAAGTPQYKSDFAPKTLRFSDTSNKKNLEVPINSLYYITSAQNYIEIFYQNKSAVPTRQILRNSLKAIEEGMIINDDKSPLIRCHKAFIVNREKIVELRGPAKMAQFILQDIDTLIPVSRQKYAEFEAQFSAPNDFHN